MANYPIEQPDFSGFANIFENMAKGYQMAAMPQQMRQQAQEQKLRQALMQQNYQRSQMENENYPEEQALKMQMLKAQLASVNQPKEPKGEYYGLLRAWENEPEGPNKDMMKARLDKMVSTAPGVSVNVDNRDDGYGKLPVGQSYYYKQDEQGNYVRDEEGNKIPEGVRVPLTEEEKKEAEGRYVFKETYPIVNKISSYYSGSEGNSRFLSDLNNVNTDPEAYKRMSDYALAMKLLNPLTAKEQQTLKASNTLGQFRILQKGLSSSNVLPVLSLYSKYRLPASIQEESGDRLVKMLTDVTEKANKNVQYFNKRPFELKNEEPSKSSAKMVKIKAPNGKIYNIPEDQVESAKASGGKIYAG